MRKIYLYITLTLGILLTACGEDKKISMGVSTPSVTQSVSSDERKLEEYQKYIEKYGEKLASYHDIYWKESYSTTHEDEAITIYFDALTSVESATVDSVYELKRFKNDETTKEQIVRAYLGNGEIFSDVENGWDKLSLQSQIKSTEKELEQINEALTILKESGADSYNINLQEEDKKRTQDNLDQLNSLLAQIGDEPSTNDFSGSSFSSYSPDESEIIHAYFNWDNTGTVITSIDIKNYQFDGTKPSSYREAVEVTNSMLEKINHFPCNPEADIIYSDDYYFKQSIENKNSFRPCADLGLLPYKKNYKYCYYFMDFNDETSMGINIYMGTPCQLKTKTENVPLLDWTEIRRIALYELQNNIAAYSTFLENGEVHIGPFINLEQVMVESEDKLSASIVPVWTFKAQHSDDPDNNTIFAINAIDGSLVKFPEPDEY